MTKMAAMAINSKNLWKSSSPEPEGLWFETWHEASGNGALQSLYKSWPWDLFYGKVNLGCPRIWMGKIVTMSFEGQNMQ